MVWKIRDLIRKANVSEIPNVNNNKEKLTLCLVTWSSKLSKQVEQNSEFEQQISYSENAKGLSRSNILEDR